MDNAKVSGAISDEDITWVTDVVSGDAAPCDFESICLLYIWLRAIIGVIVLV